MRIKIGMHLLLNLWFSPELILSVLQILVNSHTYRMLCVALESLFLSCSHMPLIVLELEVGLKDLLVAIHGARIGKLWSHHEFCPGFGRRT